MGVYNAQDFDSHEQVVFFSEASLGLRAIIAVHNTNLGPALGGCRMWPYPTEDDALRLFQTRPSHGMPGCGSGISMKTASTTS